MSWRSQRAERPTRPGPLLPPRKILVKSIGYNSLYRRERVRRLLLALAYIVLLGILTLGRPGAAGAQTCTTSSAAVTGFTAPLDDLVTDCNTLLGLKGTLEGTASLDWAEDVAMDSWAGIVVSGTPARVTQLSLPNTGLTGTIPPELGNLSALTFLHLHSNQLTGGIPAKLGDLSNLTYLDLHSNQLTGGIPAKLGDLSNLTYLDLHSNQLTGGIPAKLGDLRALRYLDLSINQLTGRIPPALGNLSNLTGLHLHTNGLTGTIPPALGNLSALTGLDLSINQLDGRLPPALGDLSNLTGLHLHSNQLDGPIPPALGDLSDLTYLDLADNELTGPIPAELGDLRALTYLDLADNELTGPIPPELGSLRALTYLDLADNQLDGPIPARLGDLSNLTYLDLSNNQLTGRIPAKLGDLSNLTYLDLSNNQLDGPIPAKLGDLSALTELYLHSNQLLTGRIPTGLGELSALTHLYLHDTDWTVIYPVPPGLLAKVDMGLDLRTNRRPTAPKVMDIALTSGATFYYRLAFSDRDGDDLKYHATLADGTTVLPGTPSNSGGMAFNPATRILSGIPPTARSIVVTVSATDEDSPPASPTEANPFCDPSREISNTEANPPPLCAYVTVIITRNTLGPSTGPTIRDQVATRGRAFSYTVPAFNNLLNPDEQEVTYRATQADGSALPAWLAFNTKTRTFSGTPPTEDSIGIRIRVTATDTAYPPYTASVTFSLTVGASSGGGGGGGGGRRPPPPPPEPEGLNLSTMATFVDSEVPSSANNSFYVTLLETNPTEKGGFTYRACTLSGEPADGAVRVGNCQWTEFVDNEFNLLLFTFNWKDGGTPPEGEVGTDAVWGQYCLLNEHGAGKWVRFFTPDGTADSVVGSASGNISYSGESLEFP